MILFQLQNNKYKLFILVQLFVVCIANVIPNKPEIEFRNFNVMKLVERDAGVDSKAVMSSRDIDSIIRNKIRFKNSDSNLIKKTKFKRDNDAMDFSESNTLMRDEATPNSNYGSVAKIKKPAPLDEKNEEYVKPIPPIYDSAGNTIEPVPIKFNENNEEPAPGDEDNVEVKKPVPRGENRVAYRNMENLNNLANAYSYMYRIIPFSIAAVVFSLLVIATIVIVRKVASIVDNAPEETSNTLDPTVGKSKFSTTNEQTKILV